MATFENCEIISTFYFSYLWAYKAALRGGNYSHKLVLDSLNIPVSERAFHSSNNLAD